eukprot:CAMPEP_0179435766 /NCGR_PEP_ID=MMETSP0799-20121207/19825_1 /TAXON_ID=46947 /ORGANISM="Geminigera cryophila, Strain CCMP2564" /LENGTH=202 /DNA_ID=CAMNT_0021215363 /DNA_START=109 /DNA_END=717 /DNA_ORIENTATION=-
MDGDMQQLLGEHGLEDAVPFLDAEHVWGLDKLRMLEESDVGKMAQRHGVPVITERLLKSKMKLLVTAIAQKKLVTASLNGHDVEVVKLIENLKSDGTNLDLQDSNGWTALMLASKKGHTTIAAMLIDAGAKLDLQNKDGNTALIDASKEYDWDIVEIVAKLIDAGAQLDLQDKDGNTALDLVRLGHVRALLRRKGAKEKKEL